MVTLLYNNFLTLYDQVLAQQPSLASEHALRQENEIYSRSTKLTYRNVLHFPSICISCNSQCCRLLFLLSLL